MSILDRSLQLEILTTLRNVYPDEIETQNIQCSGSEYYQQNLFYLFEHQLIRAGTVRDVFGAEKQIITAAITAKGLDFLEDDGGIDAILKTVTVKLDPDDMRQLIADRLKDTNIDKTKKENLIKGLQSIPVDILRTVVLKLMELGLAHAPDALQLIEKYVRLSG